MQARSLQRRAVSAFAIVAMVLGALAGTSAARSSFPDVPPGSYYDTPVEWMENWGITNGVGDTGLYAPQEVVNRAQLVTFLWRMAGSPKGNPPHGFTDVPASSYYAEAARWARAEGITTGIGGGFGGQPASTTFAPFDPVTRAQGFTFLWRYGGEPTGYPPHGFTDVKTNTYYEGPMRWARGEGITTGLGGTATNPTRTFAPLVQLTRAQMAALIHRYAGEPAPSQKGNTEPGAWVTTPPQEPPPEETEAPTVSITQPTEQVMVEQGETFPVSFTTTTAVEYVIELGDTEVASDTAASAGTTDVDVTVPEGVAAGEHDLTVSVENAVGTDSDTVEDAVLVLPSDGVLNARSEVVSDTIGEALDDAAFTAGDLLYVNVDQDGVVLVDEPVTLRSMGASLTGSFHVTADDVTIDGFEITELEAVLGEVAGIYLQDVLNATITGNTITGDGTGRGILTPLGTAATGTIAGNEISDVTTGISLQGAVELEITENTISGTTAGISSDTTEGAAVTVTANTFIDNEESIGLGGPGLTIEGNAFELTGTPDGEVYVTDWTEDDSYDLEVILAANTFDPAAVVDGNQIVPVGDGV